MVAVYDMWIAANPSSYFSVTSTHAFFNAIPLLVLIGTAFAARRRGERLDWLHRTGVWTQIFWWGLLLVWSLVHLLGLRLVG